MILTMTHVTLYRCRTVGCVQGAEDFSEWAHRASDSTTVASNASALDDAIDC